MAFVRDVWEARHVFAGITRLWVFGLAFGLVACAAEDAITMRCEPVGDPVRVLDVPASHQVAPLGDALLVSWYDEASRTWWSQWVEASGGAPLTDPLDMGEGVPARPHWHAVDSALEGVLQTDPLRRPLAEIPASEFIGWWRLSPTGEVSRRPVDLDIREECLGCATISDPYNGAGLMGMLPLVQVSEGLMGVVSAVSPRCPVFDPESATGDFFRVRFYGVGAPGGVELRPAGDACQVTSAGIPFRAATPWPMVLSDGSIGVLFSAPHEGGPGPRRYLVASPQGEILRQPVTVGLEIRRATTWALGGWQGRGARVGGHILFAEGLRNGQKCSGLRRMGENGSSPQDTPWQLPCRSEPDTNDFWVELWPRGEQAALVWSEHHDAILIEDAEDEAAWFERVKFALLNEQGQLASEPITLTPPEASARSGPVARAFMTSVWAPEDPGEDVLVSYASASDEHRGIFVQTIRCAPLDD